MIVAELIKRLQELPEQDAEVWWYDGEYAPDDGPIQIVTGQWKQSLPTDVDGTPYYKPGDSYERAFGTFGRGFLILPNRAALAP